MQTYWIGRRSSGMDIRIDHDSLSNLHAELVVSNDGRYYLTDCASTNGTFRRTNGQWQPIRQCWVEPDEPLMLGSLQTTVRELLGRKRNISAHTPSFQPDDPASQYYRHPETGEIIRR